MIRRAALSLLIGAALPVQANAARMCDFQTLCTGEKPCEPADQDATFALRLDGDAAEVSMGGDPVLLYRAEGAEGEPKTFFGTEPGEGGGMMLSLFTDGTAVMTIHGDLFGPFVATAFGTCSGAGE